MICPKCGNNNRPGAGFCSRCWSKLNRSSNKGPIIGGAWAIQILLLALGYVKRKQILRLPHYVLRASAIAQIV